MRARTKGKIRAQVFIGVLLCGAALSRSGYADIWGSGDWGGIESARVLSQPSTQVSFETAFERSPVLSDLRLGDQAWILNRVRWVQGLGPRSEFGLQWDTVKSIDGETGGGSPRFSHKFSWGGKKGVGLAQGVWLGFKWPAANEPFEIDSGDFGLQYLASVAWKGLAAENEFRFQTGPIIYGDRAVADQQNHVWVVGLGWVRRASGGRHEWSLDGVRSFSLPGAWYRFWETSSSAFERGAVGLGYRYWFGKNFSGATRVTQAWMSEGTQRQLTLGCRWEW